MTQHSKNTNYREDDRRNAAYFDETARKHGEGHRAVDWGSAHSQQLRFDCLTQLLNPKNGHRILDVGCGISDYLRHLTNLDLEINYTGIDISDEMIRRSREAWPNATFLHGSILELELDRYDLAVASGIFNLRQDDPMGFLVATVQRMYELCDVGIAFNCLSTQASKKTEGEFHVDPDALQKELSQIAGTVVLDHGYLPHDFTIAMLRST